MWRRIKYWSVQVFWLLFFWGLGQLVSFFTGGYYPGSVIGMLLLLIALFTGILKPEMICGISRLLQKNMALFFLFLVAGIIDVYDDILPNIVPIVAAVIIPVPIVMGIVGLLAKYIEKRWKK